jgi:hypothetical protein
MYRRYCQSTGSYCIKIIFIFFLIIGFNFSYAEEEFKIGEIIADPLFGDFDNDSYLEMLVSTPNEIYILEGDGQPPEDAGLWPVKNTGAQVSLAYLKEEQLFFWGMQDALDQCELKCYDINGQEKWKKEYKSNYVSGPVIWEKKKWVLFGTKKGEFSVLDTTGNPVWENKFKSRITARPEIADIDLDGKDEIILKTDDGTIYVYNENFEVKKGFPFKMPGSKDEQAFYNMTIDDINGNKYKEIIASTGFASGKQKIFVIDYNGKVLRSVSVNDRVRARAEVYDFDRDGTKEIVVVGEKGNLFVENLEKGKKIAGFPKKVGKTIKGKAYILDTNGDRDVKILVSAEENDGQNTLKIFDGKGNEDSSFSETWVAGQVFLVNYFYFADMDNDSKYEFIRLDDGELKVTPTEFPRKVIFERLGRQIQY